jgi:lysophospholipase L1-like esterase
MSMLRSRSGVALLAAAAAFSLTVSVAAPSGATPPPPPALPSSMAAIGDSITQAVDDCCSFGTHPEDSWSTGTAWPANGVFSHYQRIAALDPAIVGHASNDSSPGAKVADTNGQAQMAVGQGAQYVTVLIGANDVCTGTIAQMTPTANFHSSFQTTMTTLESGLPAGAHIFVSSIPNVYELWSVLHTNQTAQAVWAFAHICQSMLATSNTEAQRQQVLAQEEAYNAVLGQVCQQYANCRWDNDATFNAPVTPDKVSSLDYFHPSQTGQAVLASGTWASSWWPSGYWLAARDGGVFAYGDAPFHGSAGGLHLIAPVVGMAATTGGGGYWLAAADGGVFAYGDAPFRGSAGGLRLNAPVVGMAATLDGGGYWLAARDGGVFAYGDASFEGSAGGLRLNASVVGMAATTDGGGYWLAAADGGVFAYGDASFEGSAGGLRLNAPVVGMAATPDGGGYWLVSNDGGVFAYGDAPFFGSAGALHLHAPVVGMAVTPDGRGYWLVSSDGGVLTYGDAQFLGASTLPILAAPVVGLAGNG